MAPRNAPDAPVTAQATSRTQFRERFDALVRGINAGDDQAAQELHAYCQTVPALWDLIGGLEHNALRSWAQLIAPGSSHRDAFTRDHINAELSLQRQDLRRDGDSPLETLLIDCLLSAWLQVMHADTTYAQSRPKATALRRPGARDGAPTPASDAGQHRPEPDQHGRLMRVAEAW